MRDEDKTTEQLREALAALRQQVAALADVDSERRRAEAELARSQAMLTAAIECLPFDLFALDPSGRCILQNALSRKYFGDARGKTGDQVCPDPRALPRWHAAEARVQAGEQLEAEVELRVGGENRHFFNLMTPIRQGGTSYGILGVNVDITQRKQIEQALRESEARYRALAESTHDIIYILDRQGHLLYANQAAARYIGISCEDLVGKRQADLFPPEMAQKHVGRVARVFATGEAIEQDEEFHFGPHTHWLRVHLLPLRDEQGAVHAAMGVCHDITERKLAEAALQRAHDDLEQRVETRTAELWEMNRRLQQEIVERQQAEAALRQSERRFRNYFDQGLVGMAVTSADRQWLMVNDRMCQIMGYSREELLQSNWADLTHPDDLEPNLVLYRQLLAGAIDHYTMDKRFFRKDGSLVYATIHVRAFRREDGTIDHFVSITEDITARKLAEEALRQERRTLQHLLRASDHERQVIAYDIHDGLAQHLAGAIMHFDACQHLQPDKPAQAAESFRYGMGLLRQGHAESRRLISGVRPPILDEADVLAAISHLANECGQAGTPRIEFHSKVRFARLAPVVENAVYRIVQEGLTNACKHSRSDRVRIRLLQREDRLRIEVRDWGVGFDPRRAREQQFGLAGMRERARLLGGTFRVRSKPDAGATLIVELPIVAREERV